MMDPRIQLAAFLISLGITTAQKVKDLFAGDDGMDDATLAGIMAEVDRRIARRG